MIQANMNPLTIFYFQILQKIAPKSAGRMGVKLWLTPPKYKPTLPQKLLLETAIVRRMPFKESAYQASNDTFYTVYSWGKGPIVLLVHGWGGCGAQLAPLAKPLVKAGYQVIAFDALAHGQSPGKQTDIIEMIEIIKLLSSSCDGFHAIFAHSSGAVATVMAIREGARASKLVISGAAASMDYYLKKFSRNVKASGQSIGRISYYLNLRLRRNLKDFSIINIAPQLNVPALILHDKDDEVVDSSEAVALSKLWPRSELYFTRSLGHHGVLIDPATVSKVVNYIDRNQAVSGRIAVDTRSIG